MCKFVQNLQIRKGFRAADSILGSKKTRRRQRVRIAVIQDKSLFATFRTGFYDVVPSRCARQRYVPSPTLIMFGGEIFFYLSGCVLKAGI